MLPLSPLNKYVLTNANLIIYFQTSKEFFNYKNLTNNKKHYNPQKHFVIHKKRYTFA